MSAVFEVMTSGAESRILYAMNTPEAKASMESVEAIFGPQNWAGYISIGNAALNPVMGSRVVTAVCGVIPSYLYDIGARAAERKFHIDTARVYDKMFTFTQPKDGLPELPSSAKFYGFGETHCIAGMSGDPAVENVLDVYFGADPEDAEQFFGLDRCRGEYSTMYGVTYMRGTKQVVRVKVYTYNDATGHADWDGAMQIALSLMGQ